jgi:hypothetical protein
MYVAVKFFRRALLFFGKRIRLLREGHVGIPATFQTS